MKKVTFSLLAFSLLFILSSCEYLKDYLDEVDPSKPSVKDFAIGLAAPVGLDLDSYNRLWVAEAGSGMSNGKVSVISSIGVVYPVIEGFETMTDPDGNPSSLNHLLYDNGTLWILHGPLGRLYRANVANFVPGSAPLQASELEYQDVQEFVLGEGFAESNMYKITKGPGDDLFIVDAGANAILRRDAQTAEISIFAQFPPVENPTPVGPPFIDAVPTGIVFDGNRFLVSTLTGFPFREGMAKVYEVNTAGEVSVYKEYLTTLVDIELGLNNTPLVLQFGEFGEAGWIPGSGKLIQVANEQNKVLHSGFSFASDMELFGFRSAYVTNMAEGKILKVNY